MASMAKRSVTKRIYIYMLFIYWLDFSYKQEMVGKNGGPVMVNLVPRNILTAVAIASFRMKYIVFLYALSKIKLTLIT